MPKRYPPLSPAEVVKILAARGFVFVRSVGSHNRYQGRIRDQARTVTVDMHYPQFDDKLLKRMITQSGLTREEFYGSVRSTAQKIGLRADEYPIPLKD
jgi:predicted RNA binding protein YcfA (HicA-like mRNA interferase family)